MKTTLAQQLVVSMHANRKREVREIYAGLLSYYYQSNYEMKLVKEKVVSENLTDEN